MSKLSPKSRRKQPRNLDQNLKLPRKPDQKLLLKLRNKSSKKLFLT